MRRSMLSMIAMLILAASTIHADGPPGPHDGPYRPRPNPHNQFRPYDDLHQRMIIRPASVSTTTIPGRTKIFPPVYPDAPAVLSSSIETVPWLDTDSQLPVSDVPVGWLRSPIDSPTLADIGPRPSPEPRPFPAPDPTNQNSNPSESQLLADIAPEPELKATSPVSLVIAGLAATAGIVFLGMWLVNRRRSGNSQDQ